MILHVIPLKDTLKHEEKSTCHCDPAIETVNQNIIFIHNSYDGREGVEIVSEILNGDIEEKQNIETLIKRKKMQPTMAPIKDYEDRIKKNIVIKDSDLKDRLESVRDIIKEDIDNLNQIEEDDASS